MNLVVEVRESSGDEIQSDLFHIVWYTPGSILPVKLDFPQGSKLAKCLLPVITCTYEWLYSYVNLKKIYKNFFLIAFGLLGSASLFSYLPLIQRSLEFSVSYVFTEVGEGVTFERFIVQCMNLIKMIVKNYAYKPSKNFWR